MDKVPPKVEEAIETLNMQDGPSRRRLLKGVRAAGGLLVQ